MTGSKAKATRRAAMPIGTLLAALMLAGGMLVGVTACENEGPVEEAAEEIDDAAEESADELEEAADELEDEVDQ